MSNLIKNTLIALVALVVIGSVVGYSAFTYVKSTLPQLITLNDYQPLLVSKVFDRNGKNIGEFYRERRVLLPYSEIPKDIVNAFLAAEDDSFFKHKGINYLAILRAQLANLRAGHTVQGGSTITQQVAKTLLLQTNERTILRKVKDVLLAIDMEKHLSKEDILYLYLNQIYFGQGAHGIAMAAETYFRKNVKDLKLEEIAILAGLPKAPTAYSPVTNPSRAKERQVYVLNRMADVGSIEKKIAQETAKQPVKVYLRETYQDHAPFFLETLRQLLVAQIGEEAVLDKGLRIYTSLDIDKQVAAQEALIQGLKGLDKRQGYRGPLRNTIDPKEVGEFLLKSRNKLISEVNAERIIQPDGKFADAGQLNLLYDVRKSGLPPYMKIGKTAEGIVSKVDDEMGLVYVRIAELEGVIDIETMQWARKPDASKRHDLDTIKKPSQALKMGDVILVKIIADNFGSPRLGKSLVQNKKKDPKVQPPDFSKYIALELDQEPLVEGSLLSIDQQTQDILAMIGGYDFEKSKFNRALQAARQTGSSFKSIVYASALDKGYTPATPIMDAPIVYEEGKEDEEGQGDSKVWKPSNHSKSFGGDIIFRNALVKSLNIPTVKIIEDIGVDWASEYARRLGIFSPLNMDFTLALGSSSVTLYEMTKVFSEFGRLGKRTRPIIIHRVEDAKGQKILDQVSLDTRFGREMDEIEKKFEEKRKAYLETIKNRETAAADPATADQQKKKDEPQLYFEEPDQLMKPTTAYLITSLLKGVVDDPNGTGGRARALGREVAGKTGTTNGYYDAWFIGYTAQVATGVWVGFDQEKTLGKGEVGGRSALPIWVDYMKAAHENLPQMTFPVPNGIVFANIDSDTGELASSASKQIIRQAFLEGTEPTSNRNKKEEDTDFYKQDLSE